MITTRKVIALLVLVTASLALTAARNELFGTIFDYARNLYLAGLVTLATILCIHVFAVRRLLPVDRIFSQLLGMAFSGVLAMIIYDLAWTLTAYMTFAQRQGTTINWGDDGVYSGLPALGTGFDIWRFVSHLPTTIASAVLFGVVWFPLLTLLERWAYFGASSSDHTHEPITCDGNAKA